MLREFYNPEKDKLEKYQEVKQVEPVRFKDGTELNVEHTWWQDKNGELWGNFDDPMENVHKDFKAYREKYNYLMPSEIRELRKKYHLSVREFASILGIGSSTLNQIENDQRLQTKYQNAAFVLSMNAEAFNSLVVRENDVADYKYN